MQDPNSSVSILYVHNYEQQQNVWPQQVTTSKKCPGSNDTNASHCYIITLYVHFLSFVKVFLSFSERVRE